MGGVTISGHQTRRLEESVEQIVDVQNLDLRKVWLPRRALKQVQRAAIKCSRRLGQWHFSRRHASPHHQPCFRSEYRTPHHCISRFLVQPSCHPLPWLLIDFFWQPSHFSATASSSFSLPLLLGLVQLLSACGSRSAPAGPGILPLYAAAFQWCLCTSLYVQELLRLQPYPESLLIHDLRTSDLFGSTALRRKKPICTSWFNLCLSFRQTSVARSDKPRCLLRTASFV